MTSQSAVQDEWLRRVEAEYRSATLTQELGLWLLQLGASPDLIKASLLIVEDELVHSEDAFNVYKEAGGAGTPTFDVKTSIKENVSLPLESKILNRCLYTFCLGETIAVPLFTTMRAGATVPIVCKTLDRVLKDEVRHREFGWALLGWLQHFLGQEKVNAYTQQALPRLWEKYTQLYGDSQSSKETQPLEKEWGLISPSEYSSALNKAAEKTIEPRFKSLRILFKPA